MAADILYIRDCSAHQGSVAQSVEQRTENPRVGGSIPSRATISVQSVGQHGPMARVVDGTPSG
jgi:hypothetical protein